MLAICLLQNADVNQEELADVSQQQQQQQQEAVTTTFSMDVTVPSSNEANL